MWRPVASSDPSVHSSEWRHLSELRQAAALLVQTLDLLDVMCGKQVRQVEIISTHAPLMTQATSVI